MQQLPIQVHRQSPQTLLALLPPMTHLYQSKEQTSKYAAKAQVHAGPKQIAYLTLHPPRLHTGLNLAFARVLTASVNPADCQLLSTHT